MQIDADFLDMLLIATRDSDIPHPIHCYSCREDIEADTDGGTEADYADRLMAVLRACGAQHGSGPCAPGNLDPPPAASLSERGRRRREDARLAARVAARLGAADGSSREWARQIADGELREAALMLADWRVPKSARHTAKEQLERKRSSNHLWSASMRCRPAIAEARREAREADAGAEAHADLDVRRAVLAAPRVRAALASYAAALDPDRSARGDILSALNGSAPAAAGREARSEAVREAWTIAGEAVASG